MRATEADSIFAFVHQAWNRVPSIHLGDSVTLRRLRGGAAETWHIDLLSGGGVTSRGIAAEGLATVLTGRLRCFVFGNEVDLPIGHFVLLPPNTPFVLRTGGRATAEVLIHLARLLPQAIPLEPT
jgi:hypothetical protein